MGNKLIEALSPTSTPNDCHALGKSLLIFTCSDLEVEVNFSRKKGTDTIIGFGISRNLGSQDKGIIDMRKLID
jgi:hypothetical protein